VIFIARTAGARLRHATHDDDSITRVAAQIIALLKDYWLPTVGAIAVLAFWVHHKIAELLDDDEE
jgi:uncharacterized protein with ATP-grasp and redox domains